LGLFVPKGLLVASFQSNINFRNDLFYPKVRFFFRFGSRHFFLVSQSFFNIFSNYFEPSFILHLMDFSHVCLPQRGSFLNKRGWLYYLEFPSNFGSFVTLHSFSLFSKFYDGFFNSSFFHIFTPPLVFFPLKCGLMVSSLSIHLKNFSTKCQSLLLHQIPFVDLGLFSFKANPIFCFSSFSRRITCYVFFFSFSSSLFDTNGYSLSPR
jgi:hypothetical protein